MEDHLKFLIVSACLGALIGLIRQWGKQQESPQEDEEFAGLRTFVLWSMIGYSAAFISEEHAPYALVAAIAVVGLHLIIFGVFSETSKGIGFTSAAAALITLFTGALVFWGYLLFAVVLAAITMLVIGLKQTSHSWTHRFKSEDIRLTLQFVAVSGVVFPLVPNQGYGPYEAFNPFSLWLMVVLISGLGFVGYLLIRVLGPRAGIALTGLVGGLASSTATALAFSRESKTHPGLSSGFALAVIMACTVMLGRVIILIGVILPELIGRLWLPFTILALPGLLYSLYLGFGRRQKKGASDLPDIKNPLGFSIAIKFALLYGLITFLVKVLSAMDFSQGLLALSFLSGLTDMDAIALSMTNNLADGSVTADLATRAIILAAIANTLLKGGLAVAFGSAELRRHILIALGATILAGTAYLALA